ncbi:hypothetical protein BCR44DRAFT_290939 [Catenaria anguillulae PL171]|uniref:Uncharacterized protein n=1 Tax=Catenaria anguillulae PL171 TaxID=765915 RepID=A0A1Y2H9K5_9FUNG|nr:hypothetical protein BCR44DRAFT_290939 [Catenaria anguillulae PL171]
MAQSLAFLHGQCAVIASNWSLLSVPFTSKKTFSVTSWRPSTRFHKTPGRRTFKAPFAPCSRSMCPSVQSPASSRFIILSGSLPAGSKTAFGFLVGAFSQSTLASNCAVTKTRSCKSTQFTSFAASTHIRARLFTSVHILANRPLSFTLPTTILHYGHFHRIQIDAGTENVLLEWSQNRIQHLFPVHRPNPVPVNIVSSVNNTRVERLWQFTNMFIAAPLRRTLDEFRRRFGFAVGMADRVRVFCVADATCRIARHMLNTWMNTQNSHTICSLKATPIEIQQATCATTPIQPGSLPTPADAYQAYQAEGGQLQVDQVVGFDPLDGHPALHGYREQFLQQWPIADIVADIHSNYESFSPIFMHFLIAHETITKQLQQRL